VLGACLGVDLFVMVCDAKLAMMAGFIHGSVMSDELMACGFLYEFVERCHHENTAPCEFLGPYVEGYAMLGLWFGCLGVSPGNSLFLLFCDCS
jgi:hypothetical protein